MGGGLAVTLRCISACTSRDMDCDLVAATAFTCGASGGISDLARDHRMGQTKALYAAAGRAPGCSHATPGDDPGA